MDQQREQELHDLALQYFRIASSHIAKDTPFYEKIKGFIESSRMSDEAELPGFENRPMKFGKFENRMFVVMMTDIRKSTDIINGPDGVVTMFLIFYIYAGIVAKIVDDNKGTSTEFLGDGVLNMFDTKDHSLAEAQKFCIHASWDILEARETVLNPFFAKVGLPQINFGIGIDHGVTIVTKFGYRNDTDLKAFGKCVYNASKLSKGNNEINVSEESKIVWPSGPGGQLHFDDFHYMDGSPSYKANRLK